MTEPQTSRIPAKARRPGAIDACIGHRIRLRRLLLGKSREQLGEAAGVTFQQIAKYEDGKDRVGACRLWDIALALDVPLSFFYNDGPPDVVYKSPGTESRRTGRQRDAPERQANQISGPSETLDLLEAYHSVTDPVIRRNVVILVQSMCSVRPESRA
nr:helix-turn-helix transcriptional regulator [uncultured Rhodopila sp.]